MPQFLVAGYLPDDFDPSQVDEAMGREIHALNEAMTAAGVLKFAAALGREVAARAERWRSPHHRWAVPRDQGTHRRFHDPGMR